MGRERERAWFNIQLRAMVVLFGNLCYLCTVFEIIHFDIHDKRHDTTGCICEHETRKPSGGALSDALPELYSIHKGVVAKVESFGCFVSLAGFRKNGLVHVSQLADFKVESTADFVNVGDEV